MLWDRVNEREWEMGLVQGPNGKYTNVHTSLRQGQGQGAIVSYCTSPVPCTSPGPVSVNVNETVSSGGYSGTLHTPVYDQKSSMKSYSLSAGGGRQGEGGLF